MSEFGPALFIKRKDTKEIKKEEQERLLKEVSNISKELNLKDPDGEDVAPEFYDYNEYEDDSVSFLFFSSFEWGMMPPEIQEEEEKENRKEILQIGNHLDNSHPDTYEYQCYYVEN
ncbi:hypothetical protein GCM10009117_12700 [Gangjinia marincola]|uniref:Uncharacterized protein n=1 Tax=Gangjinia marincola TaxID=578463 RepID=A0ABN1MGZ7_9FLAO